MITAFVTRELSGCYKYISTEQKKTLPAHLQDDFVLIRWPQYSKLRLPLHHQHGGERGGVEIQLFIVKFRHIQRLLILIIIGFNLFS